MDSSDLKKINSISLYVIRHFFVALELSRKFLNTSLVLATYGLDTIQNYEMQYIYIYMCWRFTGRKMQMSSKSWAFEKRALSAFNLQTGQNVYHGVIVKFRSFICVVPTVFTPLFCDRGLLSRRYAFCFVIIFLFFKNIRQFHNHRRRHRSISCIVSPVRLSVGVRLPFIRIKHA